MNWRNGLAVLVGGMCTMVSAVAEDEINFDKLTDWKADKAMTITAEGGIAIRGMREIVTAEPFVVDPAKKYTLSFEIRRAPGAPAGACAYVGFWPLDAQKRRIYPYYVMAVAKTETTLSAAAAKGAKTIVLAKPAYWPEDAAQRRHWGVVFDAAADFSDLPNRSYDPIVAAEAEGANLKLTLKTPLSQDYPAGTKVRMHTSSSSGMYSGWTPRQKLTEEWQEASCTVGGLLEKGISTTKWRPGTKFATLLVLANWQPGDKTMRDCMIELKDIELEIQD